MTTPSGTAITRTGPATRWLEALPLGNGQIGAMAWGDPHAARFDLNESTFWSGYPGVTDHLRTAEEQAAGARSRARALFRSGRPIAAQAAIEELGTAWSQGYQPVGALTITAPGADDAAGPCKRSLDLARAEHVVTGPDGAHRSAVSAADGVLVHAFPCPADVAPVLGFTTPVVEESRREVTAADEAGTAGAPPTDSDGQVAHGDGQVAGGLDVVVRAPSDLPPGRHADVATIRWDEDRATRAAVSVRWRREGARVLVTCAIVTTWQGLGNMPDRPLDEVVAQARETTNRALARGEQELFTRHHAAPLPGLQDVQLDLTGDGVAGEKARKLATMFAYGRYLLAASSAPGRPPANLQGIWNAQVEAPWSSNFTVNINLEMNHWCAGVARVPTAERALEGYTAMLRESGRDTAERLYGARGWSVHHNSDPWGYSDPVRGNAKWSSWPVGGLWLERELDSIGSFSGRAPYEVAERRFRPLRDAAAFALDLLHEAGDEHAGHAAGAGSGSDSFADAGSAEAPLVTFPSISPENEWVASSWADAADEGAVPERREADPAYPALGLTEGSGMDRWLVRETLSHLLDCARLLGREDDPVVREAAVAVPRIAGPRIGADGRILEWHADGLEEIEPHHRHVSHLGFVYPGATVLDEETEAAVIATLEARGDEATGWSLAWKTCLWARLRRGERVQALLDLFLRDAEVPGDDGGIRERSGLYPNLFSAHPPFQIDGNIGIVAGIAEALLQSHRGQIELLPALPELMASGRVRGLRARPGVEVSMQWADGVITQLELRAVGPGAFGTHRVFHGDAVVEVELRDAQPVEVDVTRLSNGAET
jgi:alpha-L-fucosidase 2